MALMDMLGNASTGGIGGNMPMNNIIQQFGGINNMVKQLQMFMGRKDINPKQMAMQNLRGKHFSNETIEQFRAFAKQSGMSDEQIDSGLRQAGIIK